MDLSSRLAGAVHDIKNRLQLLQADIEILQQHPETSVSTAGEHLRSQLGQVNQQLVALLGMYKLERGFQLNIAEVFVYDLLDKLSGQLPAAYDCCIECPLDLVVFADEALLTSVLSDALHNATRFAKQSILLTATRSGAGIEISVEDDGPGPDGPGPDGPGPAGPGPDAEAGQGTGLGLHFASEVALQHKKGVETGSVQLVDSTRLGGAAFRLKLP